MQQTTESALFLCFKQGYTSGLHKLNNFLDDLTFTRQDNLGDIFNFNNLDDGAAEKLMYKLVSGLKSAKLLLSSQSENG